MNIQDFPNSLKKLKAISDHIFESKILPHLEEKSNIPDAALNEFLDVENALAMAKTATAQAIIAKNMQNNNSQELD